MRKSIHTRLLNGSKTALVMLGLAASASVMGQYSSSEAIQNSTNCFPGMNNAVILEVQVITSGSSSSLSAIQFNTNGTSATSNIESARLFYSNTGNFNNPLPATDEVGNPVSNPNGSFSFSGLNISLINGTNHFFLVYDLPYNASLGGTVDAECTGITVDANGETPTTTAPTGNRLIVKNGSYAYCAYPAASPLNYQIGISRLQIGAAVITNQIAVAGTVQTVDTPVVDLVKDVTYDLSYKGGSGNPQNERIYIDFNNDGFFEATELVFSGATAASGETSGTLPIDCGVESGNHRVRIATDLGTPSFCGPNGYGTAFEIVVNFIDAPAPVANFTLPNEAYRGAFVDYINTSQGLTYNYRWDYDNDGNVDATTINGKGQYNSVGTKTVELAMSRVFCGKLLSDSITKTVIITNPANVPTSEFIANRNVTNQTLEVSFRDLSTYGANKWHWKITPEDVNGSPAYVYINGTDSTSQNPQLLFLALGSYNVEFFAENILGAGNYVSKPDYIRNIDINDFCANPTTDQESGFLADEGGVFSFYPNYGGTGKLCTYLIQPSCAASISFNFLDFDMSSYQVTGCFIPGSNPQVLQPSDNVKIYDGVDNTGIPLHIAAGFPNGFTNGPANTPLPTLPPTVTASSGSMFIEYSVNCAFNGRGFLGEWSSTAKTLPTPTAGFDGPDTVYTDAPYIFTNTSTGDFDESIWDFDNDGLNDYAGVDAEITFDKGGTQTVKLSVARCGNTDVMTKDITVLTPTAAPTVNFSASRTSGIVLDTLRFFDISTNGPNKWKWSISPSADITFVNGTNTSSRNPFVKFNKTGMYEVKLWASNALGADSLVRSSYIGIFNYCIPNTVNLSSDIGMSKVVFGQISNSSDIGTSPYTRYLLSTVVQKGATHQITLERNTNFNNVNYKVWIDFNKNGSFTDPGEEVFVESATSALQVIGNIRIPKSAPVGSTRMRIGANSESNPNLSCGPNQFGEFEDYVIIIEKDDTKPVITLNGQPIYKMEQGYAYADAGAVAIDNGDGDISSLIVVRTNVNTAVTGEYWVSYNVTDSAGNRADSAVRYVVVEPDGSGPAITLTNGDTIIHEVNTTWTEPGYSAVDFVDGVISNVAVSGTVTSTVLGTYFITYSAVDLQGNSNSVQRVVMVKDQTAPVLSLNGMDPFVVDYGSPFADPGVTIADNYYTDLTYQRTGVINTKVIGSVVLTYDVKDPSGNMAQSITRTVEVKDMSAPKITLNGGDTMKLDVFTKYIEAGAFVSDNHTKALQAIVTGSVNSNALGDYTITYTATDSSGNVSTKVRLVRVLDREAPVIALKGSSLIQINRFAPVNDPGVTIQDNYDSDASLQSDLVVTNGVVNDIEGLYQICYQVNDKSGNKSAQVCRLVEVGPADPNGMTNMEDAVVAIYPNPTHGNFQIDLPNGIQAESIKIYNATGALVKEVNVKNAQFKYEVNMEQSTPGIYYVVVNSNGKLFTTKMSYIK